MKTLNKLVKNLKNKSYEALSKNLISDDKFYEITKNNKIPNKLKGSKILLNKCVEKERIDLALQFHTFILLNDHIISKFYEYILKIDDVPPQLIYFEPLLIKCIENNNFDLTFKFYLTDEIINKYLNKFYEYVIKIDDVPPQLISSETLLSKFIENNNFDLAFKFYLTDEIINKHIDKFYEYILKIDDVPPQLISSELLLNKCIENKHYKFATQFFTILNINDNLIDQIINDFKNVEYKSYIINLLSNNNLVKKLFIKNANELLIYAKFNKDIVDSNNTMYKYYAKLLNIKEEELKYKLEYLMEKNDEILYTIYPKMLSKDFDIIPLDYIEKLGIYSDIQIDLMTLNDKQIKLVAKILNILNTEEYDLNSIIYDILKNLSNYNGLINTIDIDNINSEELENLIYVISRSDNMYNIQNYYDLKNFENKKNIYFINIQNKIDIKNITIDELKKALLERKYGLSTELTSFICKRYCNDINALKESLNKSEINNKLYNILLNIYNIYTCNSLDKLIYLWHNSKTINTNFYTAISLESAIRKEYASMYNSTLYKLNENHRLSKNHYIYNENKKIYDIIQNSKYNNKTPDFYILDGDFNLQIHALGAYSNWSVPENFKTDWERPKMYNHGICTSYIGNDQIANARNRHPVYGFDSYETSAFLLAANYDISSNFLNSKFATSTNSTCSFYPPQIMKNKTRDSHNEIVLERRNNTSKAEFKRKPSYVVYFVDDINNIDNFNMSNKLYNETLQAAVDNNIPIIIVDRLKYAKLEFKKCEELKEKFYFQNDYQSLKELFTKFCNNIVGCKYYSSQNKSKYHEIFNEKTLDNLFNEIFIYIKQKNDTELLKYLYIISENETFMEKYKAKFNFNLSPSNNRTHNR